MKNLLIKESFFFLTRTLARLSADERWPNVNHFSDYAGNEASFGRDFRAAHSELKAMQPKEGGDKLHPALSGRLAQTTHC